ncbi:hypothetical protein DOY81_014150 [Sarcophaga bullata]|nr:hypothetical protein DOY81_014150 [Sarcophaga bullata]
MQTKLIMLGRISPWHRLLFPRYFHRGKHPRDIDKNFKEKGKADENRYFVKEHAEQLKNLHTYLDRLENRQKQLKDEMDEATRILHELEKEEGKTSEPIEIDPDDDDSTTRKKKKW